MVEDVFAQENPLLFKMIEQMQKSSTIPENVKLKLGEIQTSIEPFDPERLQEQTKEFTTQLVDAIVSGYQFDREELRTLNELADAFRIKAERPAKLKELEALTACAVESLGALRSNAPPPDCLRQKSR